MIQAIIFDVGGVLLLTQTQEYRQKWESKLGLEAGELEFIVLNSPQGRSAQHGEVTEEQHWQWVGERFNLTPEDLHLFRREFWAGDTLNLDLVAFIRQLRPQYQTAIISNAMDGLRPILHGKYPIAGLFDLIVVSAEEGIMKPESAIYERTLARLGRKPMEAVFVDDFAHNIEGAKQVGMAGVHFSAGVDVPAIFAQLGITPQTKS